MWQFNACYRGYNRHVAELRCIAVETGYYAAYYSNAKHPKSVNKITDQILGRKKKKNETVGKGNLTPEAMMALEQSFKEAKLHG